MEKQQIITEEVIEFFDRCAPNWDHDMIRDDAIIGEAKAENKKEIVQKYEFWGLVLLVAIPLPGTGAWTGALVAAMMDMRLKRAMPAIILGVIIAGVIVTSLTYGAGALL